MTADDLDAAARALAAAQSVAVLTGAGVSAESGVPTFRGTDGLWQNFRAQDLATPDAFERDPKRVWEFYNYRRHLLADVKPNPAHVALAELEKKTERLTLVTQNVDGLHQAAGSQRVIEIHGNIWGVRCTGCAAQTDRTGQQLPAMPRCDACGELLRPAVVWFGESLPPDRWRDAEHSARECDCMLVIGTSAEVYPAAGLAGIACDGGAQVIEINLEPTPASAVAGIGLYGKAGEIVPSLVARRDVLIATGIQRRGRNDH